MADIASSVNKMNDVEIDNNAPLTEALFTKLGANINAFADRTMGREEFTSSGTFAVPTTVTRVFVIGVGGGGGGGGGGGANAGPAYSDDKNTS